MVAISRPSYSNYWETWTLYRTNPAPEQWAALCFTPKTGSTAWKRQLKAGLELQGLLLLNQSDLAAFALPYQVPSNISVLVSDPTKWLMFVHNPTSRLLSTFLDKGSTNSTGGYKPVVGWTRTSNFSTFVNAVIRTPSQMLNKHYRLQFQCSVDCLQGSRISICVWKR